LGIEVEEDFQGESIRDRTITHVHCHQQTIKECSGNINVSDLPEFLPGRGDRFDFKVFGGEEFIEGGVQSGEVKLNHGDVPFVRRLLYFVYIII
jgi:hypothetical protein